ncbi:MAG: ribosome-associated translation inhibitor RaiA [Patescibacteria group bacterium]
MQVKFYQNSLKLDEKTKNYLEQKVQKLQKYLNHRVTIAEIEIDQDKKGYFRVEIQLRTPGQRFIGDETGQTIEAACDLACDELATQIKRTLNKKRTLKKRAQLSLKKKFSIDKSARF